MNRDTKSIYQNYCSLNEQRLIKIGTETVDIDRVINVIDKSNDIPLDVKNTIKNILMSKMSPGTAGPLPTPSAMTQSPNLQQPSMQAKMPMAMI